MESLLIWLVVIAIIILVVFPYYFKFRKTQKQWKEKQEESIRLGADKAVAQHPQIDQYTCIGCGACVDACPEGEILGIVAGKASIINGLKCVGHGKCAEACPVEGITIGLGDLSQRDDIPYMTDNNETNIPGLFIAGELGGLALIKNAIAQGSEIVTHIAASRDKIDNNSAMDLIIIGAGPAGLSAALAAIKNELNYLVIDQQDAGGTILQYPRKKLVMTKPVELPLYGWLDKPEYSKEELLDIWQQVRTKHNININTGEKLINIQRDELLFNVETSQGTYNSKNIILALGRRGTPRKLNVSGENQAKVMYKLIDAENYQNEHLLVVGGGDSAIEAAMGLARQKANTVTLSYRKEKFFRIKKRNQERIDKYIDEDKINVVFNSQILEIQPGFVKLKSHTGINEIKNDYAFIFAGGEPPFELLKKIGIKFGGN